MRIPGRWGGSGGIVLAPSLSVLSAVSSVVLCVVLCVALALGGTGCEPAEPPAPELASDARSPQVQGPSPGRAQPDESTPAPEESGPDVGAVPAGDAFADPASCAGCHPAEQAAWTGSQHDLAMQPANDETVLGDFDDARFTHFGKTTRFRRRAGRYFVETEGPDGKPVELEVAYTFGVEPLQQYLIAFPRGRLQALTIAWDTERGAWFSLYPDEPIAADDPLHWTGSLLRWNSRCADCHSTAFARGYDIERDAYSTEWVAVDVSCQACHGPAGAHVRWAESRAPDAAVPKGADRAVAVALSPGSARDPIETCAPCHSRRHAVSARAVPGEPLLDHYVPELLRPGLYHADGQIDDEVYVYGSFVQSRMFRRGVRCSDCHEPHGLGLRADGNDLCTRCHAPEPDPRFPSLAARDYDTPAHHFHPPGSPGAACVACHMPAKTYMQVDPRRDHSLRVPRPDLTLEIGTPNACTGCHADRDAAWAADFLAARRPPDEPLPHHFGEALAAGRAGEADAGSRLRALARDPEAPVIARATAIEMLASSSPPDAAPLRDALDDPDPLIRLSAVRGLERAGEPEDLPRLVARLRDERRAVRFEAARVLSGLPLDALDGPDLAAFSQALDAYRAAQRALGDTPEAQLNLAVLAVRRGQPGAAESAYRSALRLEPDFVPARVNLATLLNTLGRNDEAEAQLRAALEILDREVRRQPEADLPAVRATRGEILYSLGLLLAETGRLEASATALGEAAALFETRPRAHYNHGLALQRLGRSAEAEKALLRAEALAPDDPTFQHALAVLYAQSGRRDEALARARRVVALTGGAPGTRELVQQIEAMPSSP